MGGCTGNAGTRAQDGVAESRTAPGILPGPAFGSRADERRSQVTSRGVAAALSGTGEGTRRPDRYAGRSRGGVPEAIAGDRGIMDILQRRPAQAAGGAYPRGDAENRSSAAADPGPGKAGF